MNILAIGDLVGEGSVKKLREELPKIKEQRKIDFVIVNAENVAGGMGITTKIFNELKAMGIDVLTMGNHTWGKKDIFSFIDDELDEELERLLKEKQERRRRKSHDFEM